jgi:hypothetical protein
MTLDGGAVGLSQPLAHILNIGFQFGQRGSLIVSLLFFSSRMGPVVAYSTEPYDNQLSIEVVAVVVTINQSDAPTHFAAFWLDYVPPKHPICDCYPGAYLFWIVGLISIYFTHLPPRV